MLTVLGSAVTYGGISSQAGTSSMSGAATDADFTGKWLQNNGRCEPTPKNKNLVYSMNVELVESKLTVHITVNSGKGEHKLDLAYQLGGPELVYQGLDGDEFHSVARKDGNKIIFDIVEHERGKEIRSTEIWTLIDNGRALERAKSGKDSDDESRAVSILERL